MTQKLMPAYTFFSFLILCIFLLPTEVMAQEKLIKIDPGSEADTINMRYEISSMLEDLGYSWHPVLDKTIDQKIKVATNNGQYQMLYKLDKDPSIQVAVHVRQDDQLTGLHFTQTGHEQFTEAANEQYQILMKRIMLEYEPEKVDDDPWSLFTP